MHYSELTGTPKASLKFEGNAGTLSNVMWSNGLSWFSFNVRPCDLPFDGVISLGRDTGSLEVFKKR